MTAFRDLPIRRKLLLMTLTSTAAALFFASGGFLWWDIVRFRSDVRQEATAQSVIIAENSGAPLTFGDDRVAADILSGLTVRPRVELACLYARDGVVFTSYQRDRGSACPSRTPGASSFGWRAFGVVAPVSVNRERVGTLYIRRDLGDMYDRLRVGAATVLGLLLLAIGAAFLTGTRMQQSIASPLLQLADTAREISRTRNYALRATPASQDEIGVVIGAFNEMLDRITEALKRERVANRLKDEFLATVSHELRTPLNAMLGWTRMLRSARLDPPAQSKALENIERNARAQAMLIEDLLDMSRMISGKLRLQVREADLAAVVDAAVEVVEPAAAAKRQRLTVEIVVRPARTYGDPDRLQQVVWNLLSNAIKFTPPEGQVWVRLDHQNGYRLTVRDTGSGIDPEFLPLVFDRFRQGDGTSTREYSGLGLGLAIAKQLVELHGGTIEARSPGRDRGAIFEVRFPSIAPVSAKDSADSGPIEPLPAARVDGSLLRGLHVLVVDVDEGRALLQTALRQYGAHVTSVGTLRDAMTEVERHPPDVILQNLGMAQKNDHALLRKLQVRPRAQGGAVPAVAIIDRALVDDEFAAQAAGYQAHVTRPFEPSEVANLVALLGHSTQS